MKSRKQAKAPRRSRLALLASAESFTDKIRLAEDSYPNTEFDGLFRDLTEAWMQLHGHDPQFERAIRNTTMREMATTGRQRDAKQTERERKLRQGLDKEHAQDTDDFLRAVGAAMADAVAKGAAGFFADLAKALQVWTRHQAQPDRLRTAVIGFCNRRKSVSMRELMLYLVAVGLVPAAVKSDDHDDARRTVRRICKSLGVKLSGKRGRPK